MRAMRKRTPKLIQLACPATFAGEKEGQRQFSGVAYSGGVITDHPFFDRVAFDLSNTKFDTPAPALYRHDEPVGVVLKAGVAKDIQIEGTLFADTDATAKSIASKADGGMPWQLSVGIWHGERDDIGSGKKVKLNGQVLDGPLTVFRNNRIREVSFVPLGADSRTAAQIFESSKGERDMDREQELEQQLQAEQAKVTAAEAATQKEKERADRADAELAAFRTARRTEDVKALFSAIGKEFKDELAKPYLSMSDEAFTAVAAELKAKPKLPAHLASEQAIGGAGELKGSEKIQDEAAKYIAEQAKLGRTVSVSDAVTHVTATARQAA